MQNRYHKTEWQDNSTTERQWTGSWVTTVRWFKGLGISGRITLAVSLMLLFCLKAFYSVWGPEELAWILGPTAFLVEAFSGMHFFLEPSRGYVCSGAPVVIGPSCAGVNYLITACLLGVFHILRAVRSPVKPLYTALVALLSYALTVTVNSLRITGALLVSDITRSLGYAPPPWVHEAQGVAVFFSFLLLYYHLLRITIREREDVLHGTV